jgi:hypothetical protein
MSATAAPTSDRTASLRFWMFCLGVSCLALLSMPYILRGTAAWRQDDLVRDFVVRFFQDVAAGRRDAALASLSDEYRSTLKTENQFSTAAWKATEGVSVQVLAVQRQADRAIVQVSVTRNGYSVKPTVQLQRSHDGRWEIAGIEGVDVDPRWTRRQEREAAEAGEQLADELAEKLHLPAPLDAAKP